MKNYSKQRQLSKGKVTLFPLTAIFWILFAGGRVSLSAQPLLPDTAAPRVTLYGIGDDEFPIYAWTQKWVDAPSSDYTNNLAHLWPYADSMGFNVLWVSIGREFKYVDSLHNSPYRDPARHRMRVNSNYLREAAFSRAIQFYPFDSVQSPYTVWKFTDYTYDTLEYNAIENGAVILENSQREKNGCPVRTFFGRSVLLVERDKLSTYLSAANQRCQRGVNRVDH